MKKTRGEKYFALGPAPYKFTFGPPNSQGFLSCIFFSPYPFSVFFFHRTLFPSPLFWFILIHLSQNGSRIKGSSSKGNSAQCDSDPCNYLEDMLRIWGQTCEIECASLSDRVFFVLFCVFSSVCVVVALFLAIVFGTAPLFFPLEKCTTSYVPISFTFLYFNIL